MSLVRQVRAVFRSGSSNYRFLVGLVALLVSLGLVMVLSSSSIDSLRSNKNAWLVFGKQAGFIAVGFVGMFAVSRMRVESLFRFAPTFFAIGGVAQAMVFLPGIGVSVNGNRNWIKLGPIQIQPSEFWKLALIIMLAKIIHERVQHIDDFKFFTGRILAISALPIVMVGVLSKDMGTAIVMTLVVFGMLFLSGVPMQLLRGPLLAAAAVAAIGLVVAGSRIARFQAWLNPGPDDASPYDWQSDHGIWALAAGRFSGVGLGNSKLKWSWIPEVDNDYIFAIIGEEWGWIGATLIIILFILVINRIRMISLETDQSFERMLVMGVMVWISVQTAVNIAVVVKGLPVLGVPLPLISSGGSSLIATMLAIGVVLAVDRENHGIEVTPIKLRKKAAVR